MLRRRPASSATTPHSSSGCSSNAVADGRVGDLDDLRRLEGPGLGRAAEAVEQAHLAEQLAALHQREHRLAPVVGPAGDGDAAVLHHVEVLGRGALGEEHVAAAQLALHRRRPRPGRGRRRRARRRARCPGAASRSTTPASLVTDFTGGNVPTMSTWAIVVAAGSGDAVRRAQAVPGPRSAAGARLGAARGRRRACDGVVLVVPRRPGRRRRSRRPTSSWPAGRRRSASVRSGPGRGAGRRRRDRRARRRPARAGAGRVGAGARGASPPAPTPRCPPSR